MMESATQQSNTSTEKQLDKTNIEQVNKPRYLAGEQIPLPSGDKSGRERTSSAIENSISGESISFAKKHENCSSSSLVKSELEDTKLETDLTTDLTTSIYPNEDPENSIFNGNKNLKSSTTLSENHASVSGKKPMFHRSNTSPLLQSENITYKNPPLLNNSSLSIVSEEGNGFDSSFLSEDEKAASQNLQRKTEITYSITQEDLLSNDQKAVCKNARAAYYNVTAGHGFSTANVDHTDFHRNFTFDHTSTITQPVAGHHFSNSKIYDQSIAKSSKHSNGESYQHRGNFSTTSSAQNSYYTGTTGVGPPKVRKAIVTSAGKSSCTIGANSGSSKNSSRITGGMDSRTSSQKVNFSGSKTGPARNNTQRNNVQSKGKNLKTCSNSAVVKASSSGSTKMVFRSQRSMPINRSSLGSMGGADHMQENNSSIRRCSFFEDLHAAKVRYLFCKRRELYY